MSYIVVKAARVIEAANQIMRGIDSVRQMLLERAVGEYCAAHPFKPRTLRQWWKGEERRGYTREEILAFLRRDHRVLDCWGQCDLCQHLLYGGDQRRTAVRLRRMASSAPLGGVVYLDSEDFKAIF